MKPSEIKRKNVEELIQLCQSMNPDQLYCWPRQSVTRNWLAETAVVLKNLDEGDYQQFIKLSKVISPTEQREDRKKAAYEIDGFIRNKTAEYKKYDFSYLDKGKFSIRLDYFKIAKWFRKNIEIVIVTIIGGVAVGLILYYGWGIGK